MGISRLDYPYIPISLTLFSCLIKSVTRIIQIIYKFLVVVTFYSVTTLTYFESFADASLNTQPLHHTPAF